MILETKGNFLYWLFHVVYSFICNELHFCVVTEHGFVILNKVFRMAIHQYLLVVAQEKFAYVVEELESIAAIFCINIKEKLCSEKREKNVCGQTLIDSPILILDSVEENDVRRLMSRSVLIKHAFELWGTGGTYDALKESIKEFPSSLKQKYFAVDKTFAVRVKGLGKKVSLSQQVLKINQLEDVLPFEGPVDLTKPDVELYLLEDYMVRVNGQPPSQPLHLYVGRFLCDGQRSLIRQYSLKDRKFIGNTSMDSMLGMMMANLGCVRPNCLTCDPFVGTGSLLISAAHFGSYVVGGDINYKILHAQGKSSRKGAGWRQKDETIQNSLYQYGVGHLYVDALVCDFANHCWKLDEQEIFDSIITDPPYGIREACSRLGSKKGAVVEIPELEPGQIHFPEQKAYHLDDVFKDLLTFAAKSLVVSGRLVYWLPVHRADYTPEVIPRHPALKLLYNCEQVLNSHSSRLLIVMEKYKIINDLSSDVNQAHINSNVYQGHNSFRDKYFKV